MLLDCSDAERSVLEEYITQEPEHEWAILSKMDNRPANAPAFEELDSQATLQHVLHNKTLLEYPTFHVVRQSISHGKPPVLPEELPAAGLEQQQQVAESSQNTETVHTNEPASNESTQPE